MSTSHRGRRDRGGSGQYSRWARPRLGAEEPRGRARPRPSPLAPRLSLHRNCCPDPPHRAASEGGAPAASGKGAASRPPLLAPRPCRGARAAQGARAVRRRGGLGGGRTPRRRAPGPAGTDLTELGALTGPGRLSVPVPTRTGTRAGALASLPSLPPWVGATGKAGPLRGGPGPRRECSTSCEPTASARGRWGNGRRQGLGSHCVSVWRVINVSEGLDPWPPLSSLIADEKTGG